MQLIESELALICPFENPGVLSQLMEGSSNVSKILYKPPIVASKSQDQTRKFIEKLIGYCINAHQRYGPKQ